MEALQRGYAGGSIIKWHQLPKMFPRYTDYGMYICNPLPDSYFSENSGVNGSEWSVDTNVQRMQNQKYPDTINSDAGGYKTSGSLFESYGMKVLVSSMFCESKDSWRVKYCKSERSQSYSMVERQSKRALPDTPKLWWFLGQE